MPPGAWPVAIGLVVNGVTIFAFFPIAKGHLDAASFSALSALWSLLFALGNGVMQPLEQEVARAVSARRALGIGPGPVIRRALTIGSAFTVVLCLVIGALHSTIEDRLFSGSGALVAALVIGLVGFAVGHLTRGVLSSHGRFRAYAVFFGGEGAIRLVVAVVLALLGIQLIGPWGLALGASPLLAAGVALVGQRGLLEPGPEAHWSELTTKLGWLLLGTGSLSLLINSGTLAVQWISSDETEAAAAGRFLVGLQVARLPLFLFQAVLASLLPKLSRLAAEEKIAEFRTGVRMLVICILAGGAVTTAAAWVLGPVLMRVLYGDENVLGAGDLAMLAAGSILVMAAVSLDQALIALDGHSRMAFGWLVALATFAVITVVTPGLFFRVELGLLLAGLVALVWMYAFVEERLRHRAPAHELDAASAAAELAS